MFNFPTETWEKRGKKVQREGGGGRKERTKGGRGMAKVPNVVKLMTMKTKMLTLVK